MTEQQTLEAILAELSAIREALAAPASETPVWAHTFTDPRRRTFRPVILSGQRVWRDRLGRCYEFGGLIEPQEQP